MRKMPVQVQEKDDEEEDTELATDRDMYCFRRYRFPAERRCIAHRSSPRMACAHNFLARTPPWWLSGEVSLLGERA